MYAGRQGFVLTLATLCAAGLLPMRGARAQDFDLQPNYQRFGVADVSIASGYQPRVYLTTRGGALVSKRIEQTVDSWLREEPTGFVSGVDAIHWVDGANQRVRVYSVTNGRVRQHIRDNDLDMGGALDLPAAPAGDAVHAQSDVAAVTWTSGANRFIAVAAITNLGRLCVFEAMNAGAFGASCSGVNVASTIAFDLDGAVAGTNPLFAFRAPGLALGAARRTGAASYSTFNVGAPPGATTIDPSLAAWRSLVNTAHIEVAVERGSGVGLHTARINPATGALVAWTALPALPGGASPRVHHTTLDALVYNPGGGARALLYVTSSSFALYRLQSNAAGNLGAGTWLAGTLGQAATPPEEKWVTSGTSAAVPSGGSDVAVAYGLAGEDLILVPASATMVEARETGFRDHIRYQGFDHTEISVGDVGAGSTQFANESAVSSLTTVGLATAIRRNEQLPWNVAITQTLSGGDVWGLDQLLPVADGFAGSTPASMSDPYALIDPFGTNHHIVLEASVQVVNTFVCNTSFEESNRRYITAAGPSTTCG